MQHLILQLEAPLMAFGDIMIDAKGPTRDLPNVSSITGLIANALGWTRKMPAEHQRLQDRIVMGARLDRAGTELRDFQTAQLSANDQGWTTRGVPEGRGGGANTYKSPHIRQRFHRADALVTVALRVEPAAAAPTLDAIAGAFATPARPLFVGRKPCLPSGPIHVGTLDAVSVLAALQQWPLETTQKPTSVVIVIPPREQPADLAHRAFQVTDRRDWISGVHTGESRLHRLALPRDAFPVARQP